MRCLLLGTLLTLPALAESRGETLDARGRAAFQAGDYRTALKHFQEAIPLWSGQPQVQVKVLANAGQAHQALGEPTRARDLYREALRLAPDSPALWHQLGSAELQLGRFREAEAALDTAARGGIVAARGDLALLYERQGRTREAAAMLERAVALSPAGQSRARLLANLGALRWRLGRRGDALESQRAALAEMQDAAGPGHPDVGRILEDYAAMLEKSGRKPEARELSRRARDIRNGFAAQANTTGATVDWRDLK